MRHRTAHVGRRLVLAQTFIDDLAQQIVAGPAEIFDFDDELGSHPMHAGEHQRRSEAGARLLRSRRAAGLCWPGRHRHQAGGAGTAVAAPTAARHARHAARGAAAAQPALAALIRYLRPQVRSRPARDRSTFRGPAHRDRSVLLAGRYGWRWQWQLHLGCPRYRRHTGRSVASQ
jgi:hypothetical protein